MPRISGLPPLSTPANTDEIAVVHGGITKRVQLQNLPGGGNGGGTQFTQSSSYGSLSLLLADIGSTPTLVVIDSSVSVPSNTTWPATATPWVIDSGQFNISSGITLDMQAGEKLIANRRKIFTGAGKVKFTKGYPEHFYPEWWGAVHDDATDDLLAFNLMLESMRNTTIISPGPSVGGEVLLANGAKYYLSDTLVINKPIYLHGSETSIWYGSSILRWPNNTRGILVEGQSTKPMSGVTASTTSGSNVVTTSASQFAAGDVGNLYVGVAGGVNESAFASAVYVTGYTSPTQVTVSANATKTISGGTLTTFRGTNDTAFMCRLAGFTMRSAWGATTGTANVSGLTLTRLTGPTYGSFDSNLKAWTININDYTYLIDTLTDNDHITLQIPRWPCVTNGTTTVSSPGGWLAPSANWNGRSVVINGVTYTITGVNVGAFTITTNNPVPTSNGVVVEALIQSLGTLTGATTRINRFHGIDLRANVDLESIFIEGFTGDAVHCDSTASVTALPGTEPNTNNSRFARLTVQTCAGHGIFTSGVNCNNIQISNIDSTNNVDWGVYENSFLGNNYYSCHTSYCRAGAYGGTLDQVNTSNFENCYSEGGTIGNLLSQNNFWIGGNPGAGWAVGNQCPILQPGSSYLDASPVRHFNRRGAIVTGTYLGVLDDQTLLGFATGDDSAPGGSATAPLPKWRIGYSQFASKWIDFYYGDSSADHSKVALALSNALATEGGGKLWLPSGCYIGAAASRVLVLAGAGSPAGVVSAPVGSMYLRSDGGAGTCLYIKESGGTGSSGWVGK